MILLLSFSRIPHPGAFPRHNEFPPLTGAVGRIKGLTRAFIPPMGVRKSTPNLSTRIRVKGTGRGMDQRNDVTSSSKPPRGDPLRLRITGFVQRATDEFVHRLRRIQYLRRSLAAAHGKRSVEQADP